MTLLIEDRAKGKSVDVLGSCTELSLLKKRNGGASTLTIQFFCEQVFFNNGCVVALQDEKHKIFYGYVFSMKQSSGGMVTVKAYDQLRYLKTRDTMAICCKSVSQLVREMCMLFSLSVGRIEEENYCLPDEILVSKTLLDIVYEKIKETYFATRKQYVFYDDYGKLCLEREDALRIPLVIGEKSGCLNYESIEEIDSDTYNRIVLASESIVYGTQKMHQTEDFESVTRLGVLQYFKRVNQDLNGGQLANIGTNLLKEKNKAKKTMTLTAMGDFWVIGGSIVTIALSGLTRGEFRVLNVNHMIKEGVHTMVMEVENIA